jgi:hypothetical protein
MTTISILILYTVLILLLLTSCPQPTLLSKQSSFPVNGSPRVPTVLTWITFLSSSYVSLELLSSVHFHVETSGWGMSVWFIRNPWTKRVDPSTFVFSLSCVRTEICFYYKKVNREVKCLIKRIYINGCRYNERPNGKTEGSKLLTHTGFHG